MVYATTGNHLFSSVSERLTRALVIERQFIFPVVGIRVSQNRNRFSAFRRGESLSSRNEHRNRAARRSLALPKKQLRSDFEPISKRVNGQQMLRLARNLFDLLA